MILAKLCSSLSTMLNSSTDVMWSVLDWWSYMCEGAFRCSLYLSQKALADFPVYSSSHSILLYLYHYTTLHFCWMVSFSFGVTSMFCWVLPLLKCVCMPYCLCIFLILSQSLGVWNDFVASVPVGQLNLFIICSVMLPLCVVFVLHSI